MEQKEKLILREYVRRILAEDGDGGGWGGGFGGEGGLGGFGMGMGGYSFSEDAMYRTFVSGWVDLFKTVGSATKSMAVSTRQIIETTFEFVKSALIPFYHGKYAEIFKKHKQMQDQIRQEHAQTYASITNALASNDDFLVSAFMFDPARFFNTALQNPSAFVTTFSAINGPDALAKTLDILSGGKLGEILESVYSASEKMNKAALGKGGDKWENIKRKISRALQTTTAASVLDDKSSSKTESRMWRQFILVEDDKNNKNNRRKSGKEKTEISDETLEAMQAMLHPRVLKKILQGKEIQDMMRKQRNATEETLGALINEVEKLMKARSLENIESLTGKKVRPDGEIPPDVEKRIVQETQQGVRAMYQKMLKGELRHLLKSVPKDHGLARAYMKALETLERL